MCPGTSGALLLKSEILLASRFCDGNRRSHFKINVLKLGRCEPEKDNKQGKGVVEWKLRKLFRNYVEAWSNADVDSCIAPFGADGTYCDPVVPKPTLACELKAQWAGFFSGFSDLTYETVCLAGR